MVCSDVCDRTRGLYDEIETVMRIMQQSPHSEVEQSLGKYIFMLMDTNHILNTEQFISLKNVLLYLTLLSPLVLKDVIIFLFNIEQTLFR